MNHTLENEIGYLILNNIVISIIVIHNNDGYFFKCITFSMLLCIYKVYLQRSVWDG